jgi:NADH-quinone oxidoreductase subunit E
VSVLTTEQRKTADAIVEKYPNRRSAILPLLFLIQSSEGHVTEEGMREVAEILQLEPAEVLAACSFYTMLKQKPQGEYIVSVCRNISCTHMGAHDVFDSLEEHLGIETGQTTPDGKFTLESAECLATCDGAPSMQVNYEDFYNVTPEAAVDIVERLARGEEVSGMRRETVKTAREISAEIATAGLRGEAVSRESARTIGGESPRRDTSPGFRPKETGAGRGR